MLEWISGPRLDLRFDACVCGKRPAFTAVAVIALAIGIGGHHPAVRIWPCSLSHR